MGFEIKDGTGSNRRARVNLANKLDTTATIRSEREEEALLGEAYILGSGFVTLSAATPSAILYFKNDGDEDVVITRFLIGVRKNVATVSENHVRGIIQKNPTGMSGGTGTPLVLNNVNFGSSNTVDSSSELGQEGAALTGGTGYLATVAATEVLTSENASTILPKGSSIGVTIIPPSGTGVGNEIEVSVGINIHKLSAELL